MQSRKAHQTSAEALDNFRLYETGYGHVTREVLLKAVELEREEDQSEQSENLNDDLEIHFFSRFEA